MFDTKKRDEIKNARFQLNPDHSLNGITIKVNKRLNLLVTEAVHSQVSSEGKKNTYEDYGSLWKREGADGARLTWNPT